MPLVVAALALAVWVPATDSYIRSHDIPNEDVRSEVTYLDSHFRRGDVVIVSYAASYAFAYYYPRANPRSRPVDGPNGHIVAYPRLPWMVVLPTPPGRGHRARAGGGAGQDRGGAGRSPRADLDHPLAPDADRDPGVAPDSGRRPGAGHPGRAGPILLYRYQPK